MRCVVAGSGCIGLSISRNLSKLYETILIENNLTFGTQTSSRNSEGKNIYFIKFSVFLNFSLSLSLSFSLSLSLSFILSSLSLF